jgi:hypothetical protein
VPGNRGVAARLLGDNRVVGELGADRLQHRRFGLAVGPRYDVGLARLALDVQVRAKQFERDRSAGPRGDLGSPGSVGVR